MIAVPPGSESLHLQILARLVNLLSRSDLVESLRTASNPHRFVELIAKAEKRLLCGINRKLSQLICKLGLFCFASAGAHSICARGPRGMRNGTGGYRIRPYGDTICKIQTILQ